jgi:nucleotide-binding universal stress UspA family protein
MRRGEPAATIVEAAGDGYDMVVLATHGTCAPDAFWVGSITPRVAGRCRMPLLLVPVGSGQVVLPDFRQAGSDNLQSE